MTDPLRERFEFGAFRLDAAEHLLLRDGEPVPLEPKVLETLLVLIRHDTRLVAKGELMQAVWPDSFVEESNLTRNISVLRRALSPNDGGPQYIETVPKYGYRFVGDVRALAGERAARAAVDDVPRHNLPDQLTSFVGRDHELGEIERLLSSTRLLTLTGAGGCGKTRLALQVAAASLPRFDDGAWVVELTPLSEANLVSNRCSGSRPLSILRSLTVQAAPRRRARGRRSRRSNSLSDHEQAIWRYWCDRTDQISLYIRLPTRDQLRSARQALHSEWRTRHEPGGRSQTGPVQARR